MEATVSDETVIESPDSLLKRLWDYLTERESLTKKGHKISPSREARLADLKDRLIPQLISRLQKITG